MSNVLSVEHLIRSLGHGDKQYRKKAMDRLVELGEPTLDLLISALSGEEDIRIGVEEVLIRIGMPAMKLLIRSLEDENDNNLRMRYARILGKIGNPEAIGALSQVLKDERWFVALEAEKALLLNFS